MTRINAAILCLLCVSYLTAKPGGAAGTDEGGYEVLANANGFSVDIPGAPHASTNIREIQIDELNIDVREMTTGLDVEYRLYGPGAAHWGSARFTSACTLGGSRELRQWVNDTSKGKNIRKNITVLLFKSDKTPGRAYTLIDAFPVAYEPCDPRASVQTETITVNVGRIELAARRGDSSAPGSPPKFFRVLLDNAGAVSADDAWQSATGGAASHEDPPLVLGEVDPTDPTLDLSPRSTCTTLTLRGAMTDKRAALAQWINETVLGKPWRRNLTIILPDGSGAAARTFNYLDTFPTAYVFPHLSVTNTTGNVMEEVRIKPVRCELK